MKQTVALALLLSAVIALPGCGTKKDGTSGQQGSSVIVAIEGDVDSFNPLFAEDINAGEINDLIFPRLTGPEFVEETGTLHYTPLLAKSWEIRNQNRDILFNLRSDMKWSDGVKVSARDVQFSYELYGDPEVASIRQIAVQGLRLTQGKLDVSKSIEVVDDTTLVFYFERASPGLFFNLGLPILPHHVLKDIPRKELRTSPLGKNPLAAGPFKLEKWTPLQEIVLVPNEYSPAQMMPRLSKLILRVLPDYRTRVSQLQAGEVDVVGGLRMEDAALLKRGSGARVISTPGRDYDFIGWNNIDPGAYQQSNGSNVRPHKLFGSSTVRRALTMAINRADIVRAYLGEHGHISIGGVSPLFKWAYNDTIAPIPFDPRQASSLLQREGWRDTNGDGILDRGGEKFSFVLKMAGGNQLRNTIATVVQQQLRAVKIDMRIEQVERGTFWNDMMSRKYDAWFAGFSVPLQMQLDDLWASDLKKYPFNLAGFRNKRVDEILTTVKTLAKEADGASLWKEFQVIVHEEQPYTFLFWINNIVGIGERVQGTHIGVLGTLHKAWEWHTGVKVVAEVR